MTQIQLRGEDMIKKEMIAMLLAGGQGSRLGVLTTKVAKPAVSFGAKYKIIDFALSNCSNSGLDVVGILTQYQPLDLNTYVGNGQPWDLDGIDGGVFVLPPYMSAEKGEWYKGTANAIYQNIGFVDQFDPEYVVILSGDHIYKMDYAKMLKAHKKSNADATIAVIEVPWDEASRFGIMNTDADMKIVEFEEKPKKPKSNLASMGVYVFSWKVLKKYLIEDEKDANSDNDFGKNIIPKMLENGKKLMAHRFDGYWKDVGTIQSLWDANMELLDDAPAMNISDKDWRIFSKNPAKPPHYISDTAVVKNCYITEGCEIDGIVEHSILSEGVVVEEGAKIIDSVILPGAFIGRDAVVKKAIVGTGAVIGKNVKIGTEEIGAMEDFVNTKICAADITLIAPEVKIKDGAIIAKNSMVTKSIKA